MTDNNASRQIANNLETDSTNPKNDDSDGKKISKFSGLISRRWAWAVLPALLLIAFIVGLFIRFDVLVILPGNTQDTGEFVTIEGIETYPTDSEVLLTTAVLSQRPFLWEYLWFKYVDDDNEIKSLEEFFPEDITPDEFAESNAADMVNSQDLARVVALEFLGLGNFEIHATVADVVSGSAADGSLLVGDRVVEIDDEEVAGRDALVAIIGSKQPGQEILLSIERIVDGSVVQDQVLVSLGQDEADPDRALLGISVIDQPELGIAEQIENLDFTIDFDANGLGGPSAGLALTIELLDQLTEGDLLGGQDVAFTGTIQFGGFIGNVGGAPQKTVGVADEGIEYFFVPATLPEEELAAIDEFAGDDVEIFRVSTLDEVLDGIEQIGGDAGSIRALSDR